MLHANFSLGPLGRKRELKPINGSWLREICVGMSKYKIEIEGTSPAQFFHNGYFSNDNIA